MNSVVVSKVLVGSFVTTVTIWYLITLFAIHPHPRIARDLKLANGDLATRAAPNEGSSSVGEDHFLLENWTKWRIFVHGSDQVVLGGAARSVSFNSSKMAVINMEWRDHYEIVIEESKTGVVSAKVVAPWFSFHRWGVFKHFELEVFGRTVRTVPRFPFGIPFKTVKSLYPAIIGNAEEEEETSEEDIPIRGMFNVSRKYDRIIIQGYMSLVLLSVIFLLWANNPPEALKKGLAVPSSAAETSDGPSKANGRGKVKHS